MRPVTDQPPCSPSDVDLVFVSHGGPIEPKAALLAASLRANGYAHHRVIVAVAEPREWGAVGEASSRLFEELDLEIVPVQNPIGDHYPIGNKLACLDVAPVSASRRIFLDSDQLCLRPIPARIARSAVALKPADLDTSHLDEATWRQIYGHFDLTVPAERVATTVTGATMYPYFNAGMILHDPKTNLGELWRHVALELSRQSSIANAYFLDQVALPVAITATGQVVTCLDESFNFPLHLRPLAGSPYFVHYHTPEVLGGEPALATEVERLVERFPTLGVVLSDYADWRALLAA